MNAPPFERELAEFDSWAMWRYEQRRAGRPTKVPLIAYPPPHLVHASSTNPDTWRSLYLTSRYAIQHNGKVRGIGFMLSGFDPFFVIDLDGCVDRYTVHSEALKLVQEFATYTELSPSGTGLHLFCEGVWKGDGAKFDGLPWGGKAEVYGRARFMTVTFDQMPRTPLRSQPVDSEFVRTRLSALTQPVEPGKTPGTRVLHGARHGRRRDPRTVEQGERHNEVLSYAAALYAQGKERAEITKLVWDFNERFPDPMPRERFDPEVRKMLDWLEKRSAAAERAFWNQSEILQRIHDHALANFVPPLGSLAGVLARLSAAIPPWVKLPGRGAGQNTGSLNVMIAVVGPPGVGKGQAISESRHAVEFGDSERPEPRIGSGEGLAHVFKVREKGVERWVRRQALMVMGEGEVLTVLGSRQGATLMADLRGVWMGESLGHEYATANKRLFVPSQLYRLAALVALQPLKASPILADVEGGLPQRFLWLLSRASAEAQHGGQPVDTMHLNLPFVSAAENLDPTLDPPDVVLPVCEVARQAIDADAVKNMSWEGNVGVFAHRLFSRLKVAALLAILHGEQAVTEQWWQAADWVMLQSDTGRALCRAESWSDTQRRRAYVADTHAAKELKAHEAVRASDEEADRLQVRNAMLNRLKRVGAEPERQLKKAVKSSQRQYAADELDKLLSEGLAERFENTNAKGRAVTWIRQVR
jgi:hypothetical protein